MRSGGNNFNYFPRVPNIYFQQKELCPAITGSEAYLSLPLLDNSCIKQWSCLADCFETAVIVIGSRLCLSIPLVNVMQ